MQASAVYFAKNYSYDSPGQFYFNGKLQPGTSHSTNWRRIVAAPVLVRYTLTRRRQHRFQADLLGGATWLRQSYHYERRVVDPERRARTSATSATTPTYCLYLTAGPSLRYRIWKGPEATGEFTYQLKVGSPDGFYGSNLDGNVSAGVRYRFGN